MENYIQRIKDAGIVGAGGAGFPTHVKLNAKAKLVLINGAECEPLLRVDQQLMEFSSQDVVDGLKIAITQVGATEGVVCLKAKYANAIVNLEDIVKDIPNIRLQIIKDYYPAGDEVQLVYEVTKKVVPLMGIPLDVGVVVINVLTSINIARNIPVTERVITVTGEVGKPTTFIAPVGTPYSELIRACEGPTDIENYRIIVGGPMMGDIEFDWETPITKLTGGLIILPLNHSLVIKKTRPTETDLNLTKAICCQCSMCTDMCPKNILGLNTEPHKVMRGLANEDAGALGTISSVVSCNNCNLCTYYACPMDLDPGKITTMVKNSLLSKGLKTEKIVPYETEDLRDSKKVPTKRLIARLELPDYDVKAPLVHEIFRTKQVKVLLKQHIGVVATPTVLLGDEVYKGDLIGTCGDKLGANVHASINGKVIDITNSYIEIKA